jgi:hypothetical protein
MEYTLDEDTYLDYQEYLKSQAEDAKPPKQVGGSHYEQPIQPIEYIEANNLPYAEANVVKYVSRHKRKNGAEDIRKAIWYLKRILETQYNIKD